MNKQSFIIAIILGLVMTLTCCRRSQEVHFIEVPPTEDKTQFVTITDIVPDAIIEIRYSSTYKFVGERVDGYLEPTALLTKQAADSLRAVSDELKALGYRIKIFDAYRPQCAVDHFLRWAQDPTDTVTKAYFYPYLTKKQVFDGKITFSRYG